MRIFELFLGLQFDDIWWDKMSQSDFVVRLRDVCTEKDVKILRTNKREIRFEEF
jgi:hypothetical protein